MSYELERGVPETDQCATQGSPVTLLFDGYYLKLLISGKVDAAWHARSGIPKDDWFYYAKEQQRKADVGPIPEGDYWIRPDQVAPVGFARDSWGNYRITIHYFPKTETFGRGGFFIHGGKTFGSRGCIDLAQYMDMFINKLRELFFNVEVPDPGGGGLIQGFQNCHIPLSVKYDAEYVGMP
jgi:type VI secretion system (T6SS) effector TldE1-like protein